VTRILLRYGRMHISPFALYTRIFLFATTSFLPRSAAYTLLRDVMFVIVGWLILVNQWFVALRNVAFPHVLRCSPLFLQHYLAVSPLHFLPLRYALHHLSHIGARHVNAACTFAAAAHLSCAKWSIDGEKNIGRAHRACALTRAATAILVCALCA